MIPHCKRWFLGLLAVLGCGVAGAAADDSAAALSFEKEGAGYHFNTGALRGILRAEGRSQGISIAFHGREVKPLTSSMGWCSAYRLLDSGNRFGTAAWDWPSTAERLSDGAVEVHWLPDAGHPFELKGLYRWRASDTLDVSFTVTAQGSLRGFELFLASYFNGFDRAFVYAQEKGKAGFVEALEAEGVWQLFPRDHAAVALALDGRWQRPPHPVDWTVKARLAAPMAVRRDAATGLAAVLMARPEDCFAVATPYGAEGHRSLYLSLFGRDLAAGDRSVASARLVIRKDLDDGAAAALYQEFVAGR